MRLDDEQVRLQVTQAEKSLAMAERQVQQLKVASGIESKTLEQSVKQAEAGLRQMQANAALVRKGARPEQKRQVKAAVEAAVAHMEGLRREQARMQKLYQEQAIPKQQVEQVEDAFDVSEAQYRQAAEQLKLIRKGARSEEIESVEAAVEQMAAAVDVARISLGRVEGTRLQIEVAELGVDQARLVVEQARLALAKMEIHSPASGRVEQLLVEQGQVIGPGIPLVILNLTTDLEIVAFVNDDDVVMIRKDMPATLRLDALGEDGLFSGRVTDVATIPDSRAGGYAVRISVAGEELSQIKAGMYVRGILHCGVHVAAVAVSKKAVLRGSGFRYVLVFDDGQVNTRKITPGIRTGNLVEVVKGLTPGEKVVVDGHLGLLDGSSVSAISPNLQGNDHEENDQDG